MSGKKRFLGIAALAAWAVLALSCGGGEGGTGTGLVYSPGDVVLESAASGPSDAILRVVVYGPLSDVYGIAFHLSYAETLLTFVSASKTAILDDLSCSGACILFPNPDDTNPDLLIVIMSRFDDVGGVDLPDGPNVFMTLQFTAVATGSLDLSFVPGTNKVCDPTIPVCVDLSGAWYGGTVSVEI